MVVQCVCLVLLPIAQAINNGNPTHRQPAWAWNQLRPWAKTWSSVPRGSPSQGWGCVTEPGVLPGELSVLPSAAASGLLIHPHPAGVSLLGGGRGKEEREGTSVSFSQEKVNFWKQTWEETAGCHQLRDTQTGSWQEVSANPAYAELLVAVLRLKRELS